MSFINKIVDGLKVNQNQEDDEYFLDDEYYDDTDDYEDEAPRSGGSIFKSKSSSASDNTEQRSGGFFSSRNKIAPVQNTMQVTMRKPRTLRDSEEICDDLLDGRALVINLEGINSDLAQRIIDFTYGAVYSIDGEIQSISKYIFMASPHSVSLAGDFAGSQSMMGSGSQSQSYSEPAAARTSGGFSFNG